MSLLKLILLLSVSVYSEFLYENNSCEINGRKGRCKLFNDCLEAKVSLSEKAVIPTTCNFNELTICCLNENEVQDSSDKLKKEKRRKRRTLVKRSDVLPKDKHEKMCIAYGRETGFAKPQVVGGRDALEAEFPHMALLGYGDKDNIQWSCGGALISKKFVLTAAHCKSHKELGEVKFVRLGDIMMDGSSENVKNYEVVKIIRHPDYKPPVVYNDISLLELNDEVKFSDTIKPACLEPRYDLNDIKKISAAGWGLTHQKGYASDILQTVELDIFSNEDCIEPYKTQKRKLPYGILDDQQICAGGKTQEKDTCQGDSGGPLQWKNDQENLYRIIGITSVGKGCGIIGVPGIYTRVSNYIPWIESIAYSSPGDVKSLENLEIQERFFNDILNKPRDKPSIAQSRPQIPNPYSNIDPEISNPYSNIDPEIPNPYLTINPEIPNPYSNINPEIPNPYSNINPEISNPYSNIDPKIPNPYSNINPEISNPYSNFNGWANNGPRVPFGPFNWPASYFTPFWK